MNFREAKNWNNDNTYILFDDVFTGKYKVKVWSFGIKKGDAVTYKAQQINDHIWLSVLGKYHAPALLKRIPCGDKQLSNEEIYQIALRYI